MTIYKDFELRHGETFQHMVRWESLPFVYRAITAIAKQAPARITAPSHDFVDGWRVAVVSVVGMKQINAENNPPRPHDFHPVTVIDADTVELNDVNASEFSAYITGGYLMAYSPVDIDGYTARMSVRDAGNTELLLLTTENNRITVDAVGKTISLLVSATDTDAQTWESGTYELDMISPAGIVTTLMAGSMTFIDKPSA